MRRCSKRALRSTQLATEINFPEELWKAQDLSGKAQAALGRRPKREKVFRRPSTHSKYFVATSLEPNNSNKVFLKTNSRRGST